MKQYDILTQIKQADENLLNDIIKAVMYRYNALHTDRELFILSLSTDPEARNAELEDIFQSVRRCYAKQDAQ